MDELLNIGARVDKEAAGSAAVDAPVEMDPFLAQLLQSSSSGSSEGIGPSEEAPTVLVTPKSGVCIKTEAENGEKVFVNVCRSDQVPPPPAVSDAELAHAVATLDNSKYRVPMSVGEPHAELDTAKKGCTAYDVIVSEEAFAEFQAREGVREFMVELMLSHIEAKFNTRLCRDYKVLAKRQKMGQLQSQLIRKKKTIREVMTRPPPSAASNAGIKEVVAGAGAGADSEGVGAVPEIPEYTLQKEPETGRPEFYIVEVHVPKVASASTMTLDVGGRRFELSAHPRKYFLGLDFGWPVDHSEVGAQFNRKTRRLTVTLPVLQDGTGGE